MEKEMLDTRATVVETRVNVEALRAVSKVALRMLGDDGTPVLEAAMMQVCNATC